MSACNAFAALHSSYAMYLKNIDAALSDYTYCSLYRQLSRQAARPRQWSECIFFFFFLGLGFQFDQFLFWILFLGFLGLWKFEKGEWEKKRTRGRWGKNDLCLFCWRIRRRTIWVWVPVPLQTLENICTVNVADVNWARWTPYRKSANSDPIRTWKLTLKDSIYCPKSSLLDLRC